MLDDNRINRVCFVGSTPVGKDVIYMRCGETGKRVISQCGARNFLVVTPDANIEKTVAACMTSFYGNAGQRCLAGANLIVTGEGASENQFKTFYKRLLNTFLRLASDIRVGYGLEDTVQMGPLRDAEKKARVMDYMQRA